MLIENELSISNRSNVTGKVYETDVRADRAKTFSISVFQDQLEEASDGLEAAARLSEQLDRKEEAIDALREEG